jgi:hypothetical protein
MHNYRYCIFILLIIALAGCKEPTSPNEYRDELIVCGFLITGQLIDSITVQRTARIDEFYSLEAVAISNALVIVSGNGIADTLRHDPAMPGRYYSMNTNNRIEPAKTYTLTVAAPGYPTTTGSTTVPDFIQITNRADIPRQLIYLDGSLRLEWSANNHYADYLFSVTSLDSPAVEIDRFNPPADTTKPPEKTTFQFGLYGMDHSVIPWFAFNYYGRNSIAISAIDNNYYDYIRQVIFEGTDIRDIRFNLQGGIGVFGSAAVDTIHVVVEK